MSEEPFDAIVAAHHGEIYRYLRRATGRAGEADDLSQEAFLRAFRAYSALPPGANVRAWLFAIATNLCRNHFRSETRRRRAYARAATAGDDPADWPEGATLLNEARDRLEGVVGRLPTKQRLAFTLRKVHGLDYGTIGRMLRCSPDSARAHVFQAFRKIRQELDVAGGARAEARR
jgi:RNA polymerase sigma factor (sigma-70 family)